MPTILIVDDHAAVRKSIRLRFEELGFGECREAVNGLDAIDEARHLNPDLILLDFSMPIMNGIEAAKVLKQLMPTVPLLMLTAQPPAGSEFMSCDSGISRVFCKNDLKPLFECVRAMLSDRECDSP